MTTKLSVINFFNERGFSYDENGTLIFDELESIEFVSMVIEFEEEFSVELIDELFDIDKFTDLDTMVSFLTNGGQ